MPLFSNPGGTTAASQGGGIQRPGWKPPAPTPLPTSPIAQTPVGGTTTGGVNPGGFTNVGATGGGYGQSPGTAPVPGVTPTGKTWAVDPTGMATPYSPQANPWGGTDWTAGEGTNIVDLNMQRILALMKQFGMQGGPQQPLGRESPGAAPPREVPTLMADRTAAEQAEFGRAKERIGQIGGGAMAALKDRSTAGGRANSGLEAKDAREITGQTQSALGDVVRDQALDAMARHDQIDDRNLNAGLTQRGQDLGVRSGDYQGAIQQRGQDYNALLNPYQNPMLSSIPSLFGMFMPKSY